MVIRAALLPWSGSWCIAGTTSAFGGEGAFLFFGLLVILWIEACVGLEILEFAGDGEVKVDVLVPGWVSALFLDSDLEFPLRELSWFDRPSVVFSSLDCVVSEVLILLRTSASNSFSSALIRLAFFVSDAWTVEVWVGTFLPVEINSRLF